MDKTATYTGGSRHCVAVLQEFPHAGGRFKINFVGQLPVKTKKLPSGGVIFETNDPNALGEIVHSLRQMIDARDLDSSRWTESQR